MSDSMILDTYYLGCYSWYALVKYPTKWHKDLPYALYSAETNLNLEEGCPISKCSPTKNQLRPFGLERLAQSKISW